MSTSTDVVNELESLLLAMQALKAPGVSGSKIASITSHCVANVKYESAIIQKIYTHFIRTPATHKLGVLYVVDSVTRQWVDQAKKSADQPSVGEPAPDGTYAAGVNRITELLRSLMNDIISVAPDDQKEKIRKLIDIWERSATFPANMLADFKRDLEKDQNQPSTPPGSPPRETPALVQQSQVPQASQPPQPSQPFAPQANPQNASSILQALANIAKQQSATPPVPAATTPAAPNNAAVNPISTAPPPMPSSTTAPTAPTAQPLAGAASTSPATGGLAGLPPQLAGLSTSLSQGQNLFQQRSATPIANPFIPAATSTPAVSAPAPVAPAPAPAAVNPQPNPLAALLQSVQQQQQSPIGGPSPSTPTFPPAGAAQWQTPEALQQLNMLSILAAQGVPQEQLASALQAVSLLNSANAANVNPAAAAALLANNNNPQFQQQQQHAFDRDRDASRDGYGFRSPRGGSGNRRRRSRSPMWERGRAGRDSRGDRDLSPFSRRRDSPVYGEYGRQDDPFGRFGGRGKRRDFRRSPPPGMYRRRSYSPEKAEPNLPPPGPKYIEWDYSLPQGCIKVLSRTLFVGGVTTSEDHLKELFTHFGVVQTCIVNVEKRHAFIKMVNRSDATNAREGMESYRYGDMQLRTRWGVGFGPRDCSDYQTGVSTIPIHRLTDADRRWITTAEYGGTGGKPLQTGMVVEEPDIEIGAGVSSKAISRRMATDTGGKRGPTSSRSGPDPRFPPKRGSVPSHMGRGGYDGDRDPWRQEPPHWAGPASAQGLPDYGNPSDYESHPASAASHPQPLTPSNTQPQQPNLSGLGVGGAVGGGVPVPPAVPGFGFQYPGMSMFPGNFMMPQNQSGQGSRGSQQQ